MPPREAGLFGERQRLISPQMDHDGEEQANGDGQVQQNEAQHEAIGFWEAVQQRRENSDSSPRQQRNKWVALGFGQLVAFIAASVNVTSFALENSLGVMAPSFQLFLMYIFLTMHLCFRSPPPPTEQLTSDDGSEQSRISPREYRMPLFGCLRLRVPWYVYGCFSCLDVGAGIIMLRSLQYTSLTSVTLLSSLTIPSTMLFSKLLMDKSFYAHHFLGVMLCALGGCLTLWSDLEGHKSNPDGSSPATTSSQGFQMNVGDLMAILAALLYGLGDAASEYAIKHIDRNEFLGMIGLFGLVLTGLQFPFQEMDTLARIFSDPEANVNEFLLMGGYVSLLLAYYETEALFLASSDATLLNLSLQAQNFYAITFSVLVYRMAPPPLFYIAVAFVGIGVFVYELGGPSSDRIALEPLIENPVIDETAVPNWGGVSVRNEAGWKQGTADYSTVQQIEVV